MTSKIFINSIVILIGAAVGIVLGKLIFFMIYVQSVVGTVKDNGNSTIDLYSFEEDKHYIIYLSQERHRHAVASRSGYYKIVKCKKQDIYYIWE